MSTKKTTTQTTNYDPAALSQYNTMQPAIQTALTNNIADPWTAMAGNQQMAAGNNSIFGQSQNMFQNAAQRMQQSNLNTNSPLFAAQLARMRRVTQGAQGNMYSNLLLNAQNLQTNSATAASQYQPLQSGVQTTQQTSGLGTWLPQVAAAGMKAGMAFA